MGSSDLMEKLQSRVIHEFSARVNLHYDVRENPGYLSWS